MSPKLHRHHDDDNRPAHQPREELQGRALRLTAYLGDGELFQRRPVYTEIVHRAHRAGLAGASVLRGMEGFGRTSRTIHTTRLLDLADHLPLLVVIVDTPERVRAFIPQLREVSPHSLVTVEEIDVVAPGGTGPTAAPDAADGASG